jgi:hypothetical protein
MSLKSTREIPPVPKAKIVRVLFSSSYSNFNEPTVREGSGETLQAKSVVFKSSAFVITNFSTV